ncbi:MAG: M23 family peptidase [Alphaproteobacteria bacterium]|nr:MAG: M23 family peptidase [Alphaproteobacteria bacterium]
MLAGGTALGAVALVSAVGAALLAGVERDRAARDLAVMRAAYEARIAALAAERDDARGTVSALHRRVEEATRQLALTQAELVTALEAERARSLTLAAVRRNLAEAVRARDLAEREREALALRLAALEGDLSRRAGSENDLSQTLGAVSAALADSIRRREAAEARLSELNAEIAALEERNRIDAQRMERAIGRIEEAVLFSLGRMQTALAATGFDVEEMLASLRESHSGQGGPLLVLASAAAEDETDPQLGRLAALMADLERVELMRVASAKLPLAVPVKGSFRFTSGFGTRKDPRTGRPRRHEGIDLAGARGTPILATAEGTVVYAGRMSGYGNVIKIRHAFGVETVYGHLSRIRVKVGDKVVQGEHIGDMGSTGRSTGTHLHYEVRLNGNPVNPMTYLKAARDVL